MKKTIYIAILSVLVLPAFANADFSTSLKYGMSGTEVSALQDLLVSENCLSVTPTGYFGVLTLQGVKCFQTKYDIQPISGYFGILSRTQANLLLKDITKSSDQAELAEIGSSTPATICGTGDLFNASTGKPCSQIASSTLDVQSDIKQIKQDIQTTKKAVEKITTTPIVPTLEVPTISLGTESCDSDTAIHQKINISNDDWDFGILTLDSAGKISFGKPTSEINIGSASQGNHTYSVKLYHFNTDKLPHTYLTEYATLITSTSGTLDVADCNQ